jgi:hypothetical protein
MEPQGQENKNHGNDMTAVQIERLKLEIENLRSSNEWGNRSAFATSLITALIAIASFWVGIHQFRETQNREIEKLQAEFRNSVALSEKEFRRRFYEKQMDLYFDISKTAAQISITEDPDEIQKLHRHFLEIYNGNLNLVQDRQVMNAARQFEQSFNEHGRNQADRNRLRESARALSEACRNSIRDIWNIPFLYEQG